jgi:hypothetical protein
VISSLKTELSSFEVLLQTSQLIFTTALKDNWDSIFYSYFQNEDTGELRGKMASHDLQGKEQEQGSQGSKPSLPPLHPHPFMSVTSHNDYLLPWVCKRTCQKEKIFLPPVPQVPFPSLHLVCLKTGLS